MRVTSNEIFMKCLSQVLGILVSVLLVGLMLMIFYYGEKVLAQVNTNADNLSKIGANIDSINEYLQEPVREVTEEEYDAILNAIK